MKLIEKLQSIPTEVQKLRESLGIDSITPASQFRNKENAGLGRNYRAVVARSRGSEHEKAVESCARLMADVYKGRRPMWHLREAMTTSDFPNLFGDLLYRQLLGNYMPYPVTYPRWSRIVEVNDFRKLHLYTIDGGQGLLGPNGTSLQAIKEREPYPEIAFQESPFSVQVLKYGRRYGISFEMIINDDLNAFQSRPQMMAVGARRSEEYLMTSYLCDTNGPNANFFSASGGTLSSSIPVVNGVSNRVTTNPALSIQGLQTAMVVLAGQKDLDGQPIVIDAVELVVPPALEITAQNILHATDIRVQSSTGSPAGAAQGGATIDQYIHAQNWMRGRVTLSVNSYIPIISTATKNGVNVGNTSWYLLANPNNMASRPAFVFAFMRGRRQPQLFIKDSDARMLGSGGETDPMEGNFDSDAIDYKMRHIFGATSVDPRMAVASDGSEIV